MDRASSATRATAMSLAIDGATAKVAGAWKAAGVPCILLKGASLTDWLYVDGPVRAYGDTDLLVPPDRIEQAERELRRLGFVPTDDWLFRFQHARQWNRAADGISVDLHRTLPGIINAPPDAVWAILSRRTTPLNVGGRSLDALDPPGRALLIALHAAHHGDNAKALADLERGVELIDVPTWRAAAALAEELDTEDIFAAGLRKLPAGSRLADELGVVDTRLLAIAHGKDVPAPLALGLARLAGGGSLRAKLRLLRRELFPSPARLRWYYPVAARGRIGLAAGYALRIGWLVRHTIPSVRAWRRLRRAEPPRPE